MKERKKVKANRWAPLRIVALYFVDLKRARQTCQVFAAVDHPQKNPSRATTTTITTSSSGSFMVKYEQQQLRAS